VLFEDSFSCTSVNHQKYDRVARIYGTSTSSDCSLSLDIHTELFPFASGDQFQLTMASTLALDGSKDDGKSWREVSKGESTLADHYDYVCYGKVYKFEEGQGESM